MIGKIKLKIYTKILYPLKIRGYKARWTILLYKTLWLKKCYFGPYTGEFGHLLGHNLPFIAYLYSKGVKVEFCGMEIHKPFFVDESGNPIVHSYLALRDFFAEYPPSCNLATGLPQDVKEVVNPFVERAKKSFYPYWDNSDRDIYFYYFRWWIWKKQLLKTFDLSKVYKTDNRTSLVIFPRKWNANFPDKVDDQTRNNGLNWNYYDVSRLASKYFEKVYVIGHPVFTKVDFDSYDNVEVILTNNNQLILEKCSNAGLIITQHSGTVYLGEYTNTRVLIIYNGGRQIGDIEMTTTFKQSLGNKYDFQFAFSMEEIEQFLSAN